MSLMASGLPIFSFYPVHEGTGSGLAKSSGRKGKRPNPRWSTGEGPQADGTVPSTPSIAQTAVTLGDSGVPENNGPRRLRQNIRLQEFRRLMSILALAVSDEGALFRGGETSRCVASFRDGESSRCAFPIGRELAPIRSEITFSVMRSFPGNGQVVDPAMRPTSWSKSGTFQNVRISHPGMLKSFYRVLSKLHKTCAAAARQTSSVPSSVHTSFPLHWGCIGSKGLDQKF